MTISNFNFKFTGHGHYFVTYTSTTGKVSKSATITDMQLIDETKNEDSPKGVALQRLYNAIKAKN